ncbi:hypothetical protein, partial [Streptomyces sp. 150FB]|uniref:hypothetical protein n=1 Tax=Streptomyces sp. 150FB TaxID=1576605 RepID=UPI000697E8C5
WERRGVGVPRLAESALHNPGWLDDWLAAEPENPDAVLVKADLLVKQAWEIRTEARAQDVSKDQFQAFFALLDDAVPTLSAAAELNPADPVPWQVALAHATGSQAPREVFDAYWHEAVARAPHHYGCHVAALQYVCDKWHGSHEEMFEFAERAAEGALPGSLLHALPLLAAFEYEVVADSGTTTRDAGGGAGVGAPGSAIGNGNGNGNGIGNGNGPRNARGRATAAGPIARRRVDAAVTRALRLCAGYEHGDPEVAHVRNHLALMLIIGQRHEQSLEQFRALGVHATEFPWALFGDPRRQFLDFRTGVRMHVASQIPFFSAPVRVEPAAYAVPEGPGGPGGSVDAFAPHSLALVSAPPHRIAEAALLCGVPLRIAAAPGFAGASYVEIATGESRDKRAALLGEERLAAAADNFTTGERWPALVLRRTADRHGFTLLRKGKKLADHEWDPAAPVPDHATATATAKTLGRVYGIDDIRPLTALLRGSDAPARRQSDLVAALGLPPLPEGFGERDEVLKSVPDAQVLAGRGLLAGLKAVLTTAPDRHLGATRPVLARPRLWWTARLAGLALCLPATVWAWWSPDIGPLRAVLATVATLSLSAQLARAWRQRPRRVSRAERAPTAV